MTKKLTTKKTVLADQLEDQLVKLFLECEEEPSDLEIDLGKTEFIEIASLSFLISFWLGRQIRQKKTSFIRLPQKQKTRDFLKLWRFIEALASATRTPEQEILPESEKAFLEEPITTYTGSKTGLYALELNNSWKKTYSGNRNFFEFKSFIVDDLDNRDLFRSGTEALPKNESMRWQGELIKAVLRTHLSGGAEEEDEVARVVIFESLANAIQHPAASIIQKTSIFLGDTKENGYIKEGHLTICVWDDGESIIDTLAPIVRSGGIIRAYSLPSPMYDRTKMIVKKYGKTEKFSQLIRSAEDPAQDAANEWILLSSTFPGLTRKVAKNVSKVDKLSDEEQQDQYRMGFGLYALKRTVVDLYGGSLSIRSKNCFLNLTLAPKNLKVRYKASVMLYPEKIYPEFVGNLIIMRIPIKR